MELETFFNISTNPEIYLNNGKKKDLKEAFDSEEKEWVVYYERQLKYLSEYGLKFDPEDEIETREKFISFHYAGYNNIKMLNEFLLSKKALFFFTMFLSISLIIRFKLSNNSKKFYSELKKESELGYFSAKALSTTIKKLCPMWPFC